MKGKGELITRPFSLLAPLARVTRFGVRLLLLGAAAGDGPLAVTSSGAIEYPTLGFAIEQGVPEDVHAA